MRSQLAVRPLRRRHSAQGLVETALVLPLALLFILGVIMGAILFLQSEAVTNAARGGARAAQVQLSGGGGLYVTSGSTHCESGTPVSIGQGASEGAIVVPVQTATLCTPGTSTTQLTQPYSATKATVSVLAKAASGSSAPALSAPCQVEVTVTYTTTANMLPFGQHMTFTASSTLPVVPSSATGSAYNC